MHLRKTLCLIFAATTGSVPALAATPLWSGDFETGDLPPQGSVLDVAQGSTLEVVDEPVREGRHAMRVTVVPGGLSNNGNRAEVVLTNSLFREGDERWFHWYTLFPADFLPSPKWHLYTQWHSGGPIGVPLQFSLHGETLSLRLMGHQYDIEKNYTGGILWDQRLQLGKWNEYLFHVKFSGSYDVGFVELWVDGKLVVPKTMHRTLDPGDYAYLKFGLYRDKTIEWNQTIFQDGMRVYASDPRKSGSGGGSPGGSTPDGGKPDVGSQYPGISDSGDTGLGKSPPEEAGTGCGPGPGASGVFLPGVFAFALLRRTGRRRRRAESD